MSVKFDKSCIKIAMKDTFRKKWSDLICIIFITILVKRTAGYWCILVPAEIITILYTFVQEYKETKEFLDEYRSYCETGVI